VRAATAEHLPRPLLDAARELRSRHVEAEDERGPAPLVGPQAVAIGSKRRACAGELERADDTAPVVRMQPLRRGGIAFGEQTVGGLGAEAVVEPAPALAGSGSRRWREVQLGQRGTEIEAGPADDDRRFATSEDLVDLRVCEPRVLRDGRLLPRIPD